MTNRHDTSTQQLGFDDLLQTAEHENEARKFERQTAHLPGSMDEAIPFFRDLIEAHHAAMLAMDIKEVMRLREEAYLLAVKLNGGNGGICAHNDAPAYVLERATKAAPGTVPLWGQTGTFEIAVAGTQVRIEMAGLFGIGRLTGFWLNFGVHAVDPDRPFISPTGYRSFYGVHADPAPGLTPAAFAERCVMAYVERELRGGLVRIEECYRDKLKAE